MFVLLVPVFGLSVFISPLVFYFLFQPYCQQWYNLIRFCIYFYSVGGGGLLPEFTNIFNICTTLDPTTTIKKNAINHLLTGSSSFFFSSEVLPSVTVPRLVMFLSNFLFLLAIALGIGCHLQLVNRHNRLRIVGVCQRDISI